MPEQKERANPLTGEQRARTVRVYHNLISLGHMDIAAVIYDLLGAEAFWREAVKTSEEFPSDTCAFCGVRTTHEHIGHCAWKLAQE